MNVLMVDDHVMFLQGMKHLLTAVAPELRVETTSELAQAVRLVRHAEFDLVLLDWHLDGGDGEESIRRLRDAGCMARIVVLSGETDASLIRKTVDLGAAGFIPKKYSSDMMVAAIGHVLAGRIFLPQETPESPAEPPDGVDADLRLSGLTARQRDVYRAATRGLPNKLIARQLNIAESTVKAHLTAVFAALGVRNRTEAAYQASRRGVRVD
jgi:DNA-binding NarL/FixJ family response regulator